MQVTIKEKKLDISECVDVLVVGGGPAGVGAAVAAARQGSKVMLLEHRGFLGGNITGCYVENCNYFMKGTPFRSEGIYAEIEERYEAQYGNSHDLRTTTPPRFSSEYLKVFLDEFIQNEGINLKLHAFVNDVIVEDGKITAVIIQSKKGPVVVKANIVIDCTGDGDVAFSAGVPYEQGREKDGLCQPGTVSFRVAGANAKKLMEGGDQLNRIGQEFKKAYRAGTTGLNCKRQDLPFGRLTPGGQISYLNYACVYGLDPTDIDDLTKGQTQSRQYIMELYHYLKDNFDELKDIEVASISPEIGFRDSRRIKGLHRLTIEEMESNEAFEDVIAVFPRFYDMLAPDANMDGDGSVKGAGYEGHIFERVVDDRTFSIPYRCLLPITIDNLLVAGRCISSDHVAESGTRAISLCMMTGQAAGAAAAIANKQNIGPKDINVKELQNVLREQKIKLPE